MSRELARLQDEFREKTIAFQEECEKSGLDVLIYYTFRTDIAQAKLFRQGRSFAAIKRRADLLERKWGRPDLKKVLLAVGPQYGMTIVTHAAPGQSLHNYGYAFDAAPQTQGRINWSLKDKKNKKLWLKMGAIGKQCEMEWGGGWSRRRRDYPHFQQPDVRWQTLIQSPRTILI